MYAYTYMDMYICVSYARIIYILIMHFASTSSSRCHLCPWKWMRVTVMVLNLLQCFHFHAIAHCNIFIVLIGYLTCSLLYTFVTSHNNKLLWKKFDVLFFSVSSILFKLCMHAFPILHMIELKFPKIGNLEHFCSIMDAFSATFVEHCFLYINLSSAATNVSNLGTQSIFFSPVVRFLVKA